MARTEETFDDYIADAELYKIDVTKLDAKKARTRLLMFNAIYGTLGSQIFIWAFFFGSLWVVFPKFITHPLFIEFTISLGVVALCINLLACWKAEGKTLLLLYIFSCASIGLLILFIVSIFSAESGNISVSSPWNWALGIFSLGIYFWSLYRLYRNETVENNCQAIFASKCIDFKRKLYCNDLDDRKFENNVKPTRKDRFLVGILIAITPFIQLAILKYSDADTSASNLIGVAVIYALSWIFMLGAISGVFKYQAIKKIQKDLGYRLIPIKSDRKQVSFWSMGWYR